MAVIELVDRDINAKKIDIKKKSGEITASPTGITSKDKEKKIKSKK